MSSPVLKIPYYQIVGSNIINQPISYGISYSLEDYIRDFLKNIKEKYTLQIIANESDLMEFLRLNPTVIDYINPTIEKLKEELNIASLFMDLVIDPEEDDDGTLFIEAELKGDVTTEDLLQKLNKFLDSFFIPLVGKDITKFNVDLI